MRADLPGVSAGEGRAAPGAPVQPGRPEHYYVLQTGLTGPRSAAPYPNHLATYTSAALGVHARAGAAGTARAAHLDATAGRHGHQDLRLPARRSTPSASTTRCTTAARRLGGAPRTRRSCATIRATKRSMFNVESYAFRGPAIYDGTKYRKLNIDETEDSHLSLDVTRRLDRRHAAPLRERRRARRAGQPYHFTLRRSRRPVPARRRRAAADAWRPAARAQFKETLFVGPKLQKQLDATLTRARAASPTTASSRSSRGRCSGCSSRCTALVGNWGLAIILVTFLLKLLFYPLARDQRPLDGDACARSRRASRTCRRPTRTTARSSAAR